MSKTLELAKAYAFHMPGSVQSESAYEALVAHVEKQEAAIKLAIEALQDLNTVASGLKLNDEGQSYRAVQKSNAAVAALKEL